MQSDLQKIRECLDNGTPELMRILYMLLPNVVGLYLHRSLFLKRLFSLWHSVPVGLYYDNSIWTQSMMQ